MSKQNGTLNRPMKSQLRPRLARTLRLLFPLLTVSLMLSGCVTTSLTATKKASFEAAFRPITYSSSQDTANTVRQIRVHNATGHKLGLW